MRTAESHGIMGPPLWFASTFASTLSGDPARR